MRGSEPIRLILVRHGNTFEKGETPTQVGAQTDIPLTALGRQQAEDFARYLMGRGIDPKAIYAGALKRQTETARIVGKVLGADARVYLGETALTEVDYGLWEGLTADEIDRGWPSEYKEWHEVARWGEGIFGGEFSQHVKGIGKWLEMVRRTYSSGDAVVAVTSNGTIRFFYTFLPGEWQRLVQERKMEDLKVKTGHFCELLLFRDKVEVVQWNISSR